MDQFAQHPLAHAPAPSRAAVFLDFDGVLVDLAPTPDAIDVPGGLPDLLARLGRATGGATAIVTGRAVADIRSYLPGVTGWLAGCHGGERARPGQSDQPHPLTGTGAVTEVQRAVTALASFGDAVVTETKPLGAVVHYRRAPELQDALERAAQAIAAAHSGFECHPAKMAFELRPRDVGKDRVVAEWMGEAPFVGRCPIYFGDDLTDEPAMDWVQKTGGIAVKVGEGDTVATHRVADPAGVLAALEAWVGQA
ncbi:MAG: trehalose-phosphatase [Pseudomonadota bacterium]